MAFKSILVPFDNSAASRSALVAAYHVAQQHSSHIEVFHVQADPRESIPNMRGEGYSGEIVQNMIDQAGENAEKRSLAAHNFYEEFCAANNIPIVESGPAPQGASIWWHQEVGREDQAVALRGRRADLIVVGRPQGDTNQAAQMTLHAAIFETTKPVLVAPADLLPDSFGRRIAIAWNGSMQASRAVSSTIPFLTKADEVLIVAMKTEQSAKRLRDHELGDHLAWHGVETRGVEVLQGKQKVGEALLKMCASEGVDLLVMGAFSHSGLMQIIFGGVTRYVIENTEIPVLMSH